MSKVSASPERAPSSMYGFDLASEYAGAYFRLAARRVSRRYGLVTTGSFRMSRIHPAPSAKFAASLQNQDIGTLFSPPVLCASAFSDIRQRGIPSHTKAPRL
jgi:hypothetical protein